MKIGERMSVHDVAERLGIRHVDVYRMVESGELALNKENKRLWFSPSEVEALDDVRRAG